VRRSLLSAVLFALPLIACTDLVERGEVSITPEPERPLVVLDPRDERTPRPAPVHATQGGNPEVPLPHPTSGVLGAGEADKVLTAGAQPIVKLLDPGADPRADLSYALTKGSAQKMVMAMDMAVGVKAKGQTMPQTPMPRMTMTFDNTAADKNPAGEFKIDSRLTSATVDPNGGQQEQMARALRPQIEAMKGLGMVYWVNPKGHVRDVKLEVPAGVPPSAQQIMNGMSQSFESMVTPLPAEPVGVGARWQVVNRISNGGADILQSAIYTLKSRTGAKAVLDVALVQLAASDTIHTAQMPAGMSAKIKTFSSSGSGSTQVDTKSVAPEGGTIALKTSMEITVQGGGSGEESTVDTATTVTITRP
jgi:hypothetical protein